ncbi:MAG: hypothetical protein Q8Q63_06825, partial [Phaeovulum sp.]|uniref:hypothetical protein n=1 Tax=Phaeovulum sp. TaxID=2934796 RepID=UPI002735B43C
MIKTTTKIAAMATMARTTRRAESSGIRMVRSSIQTKSGKRGKWRGLRVGRAGFSLLRDSHDVRLGSDADGERERYM